MMDDHLPPRELPAGGESGELLGMGVVADNSHPGDVGTVLRPLECAGRPARVQARGQQDLKLGLCLLERRVGCGGGSWCDRRLRRSGPQIGRGPRGSAGE